MFVVVVMLVLVKICEIVIVFVVEFMVSCEVLLKLN